MEVLRQLMEDAQAVLKEMTATQRVAVACMAFSAAALLTFLVILGSAKEKSGFEALPMKVPPDQMKDIQEQLAAKDIESRYDLDTQTLSVQVQDVDEAVLYLASENLLPADSGGFADWIKQRNFSDPREVREDIMKLALETEMGRMVENIDSVKYAKVIYRDFKRRSLFQPNYTQRAAVIVHTKMGKPLTRKTADTIIALVAAARPGLDPEGVDLTDQNGRHFRAADPESLDMINTTRFEMQNKMNEHLREKVEAFCRAAVPGPGMEAFAFVDHQLDMSKVEERKRQYSDGPKHHEQKEKYSQQTTKKPPAEVGTRPNVARAANLSPGGFEEESLTSRKFADTTYQNNITDTYTQYMPKLTSLTLSAIIHLPYKEEPLLDDQGQPVVDDQGNPKTAKTSEPPLSDEKLRELERKIHAAAGMMPGDQRYDVQIMQVPWREPWIAAEEAKTPVQQISEIILNNITPIIMVMVLLVSLWLMYSQAKRALPSEEMAELLAEEQASMTMIPEMSEVDKQNATFEQLRNKVADVVAEDPRKAANLVRKWMTKGEY